MSPKSYYDKKGVKQMKTLEELKETPRLVIERTGDDGGFGYITFMKYTASVVWSFGGGWEHVSVAPLNSRITPSWDDMCKVKDMFWHGYEAVIQIHPPKSEYVNNLPNCLHLWKPRDEVLPLPPSFMVGLKKDEKTSELVEAIKRYNAEC